MATITQKITIDVARANVFSAIIGKQFDTDSRFLKCTLAQEGVAMEIESGVTVSINARRPDNTTSSFAGERNADGTVTVPIDEWILEQNGMVSLSVSIVSASGEKLTSCTFYLNVQQAEGEGWLWVYTATGVVATGTYHINFGGTDYEFTLPTALESGDKIYFSSALDYAKSVEPTGAEIDTMILTVGSGGTALVSSELINFLASLESELASYNSRVEGVEEALTDKADKSGEFENLTAGTANAVIDKSSYTPHNTPYLHRISPSGKRCEYDVIGGTVGWNQLVQPSSAGTITVAGGVTRTISADDATITLNGTATASDFNVLPKSVLVTENHIYAFLNNFTGTAMSDTTWQIYIAGGVPANYFVEQTIQKATSSTNCNIRVVIYNGAVLQITLRCPQVIDLTTLLGSTIADYAYQLEQTTAGSGIAWLKKYGFLTKPYYAYDSGSIQSVKTTGRKVVGKNLFGETQLNYRVNTTTGEIESASNTNWISNRIGVFGKPYTVTLFDKGSMANGSINIARYKADGSFKDYVSFAYFNSATPFTHTYTETDVYSIIIYGYQGGGATAINTAQMQVEFGSSATTYQPYTSTTYPFAEITLRGIPKLDSNNNIYYDGDKYKADGSVKRRYGVVDLGTLTWTKASIDGNAYYSNTISDAMAVGNVTTANVLCAKYDLYMSGNGSVLLDKTYRFGGTYSGTKRVTIRDDSYTTADAFKTAMSGVYLVYELATPTTETADPFTPIQYTGNTEEFSTDNDVPVGVEGKYYNDTEEVRDEQVSGILRHLLTLTKNVPFANSTVVDLGNLSWTYANGRFNSSTLPNVKTTGARGGSIILTNGYTFTGQEGGTSADKSCFIGITGFPYLYVYDSSYTDATTFKQAMSGVLLAYETT